MIVCSESAPQEEYADRLSGLTVDPQHNDILRQCDG